MKSIKYEKMNENLFEIDFTLSEIFHRRINCSMYNLLYSIYILYIQFH